jgi:hypothetical protein
MANIGKRARGATFLTAAALALAHAQGAGAQSPPEGLLDLGLDVDAGIGYLYDDNVTRAPAGPDKIADQFYSLNASRTFAYPVTDRTRFTVDAFAGGELAQKYSDLGSLFAGAQGALQYRGSAAFDAPTLALFARVLGEHFGSSLRSGFRYSAGVSARQPITQDLGAFVAYAYNGRDANNDVFDTHDNALLASVDYSFAPYGTLTLTAEFRRGTIVSTGQATLTIIDIAQVFVDDDVFTSPQMINYRFEADTVLTTVDYTIPINARAAVDFSWRRAKSKSRERASFPGGGSLEYVDNQYNLQLLLRF